MVDVSNNHRPLHDEATLVQRQNLVHLSLAAIAQQVGIAQQGQHSAPEQQILLQYLLLTAAINPDWRQAVAEYLEHPADEDATLLHLAQVLDLTWCEVLTVALASAVEEQMLVGRLLAFVQAPLHYSRPTLGLLADCFAPLAISGGTPLHEITTGAALASGLIQLVGDDLPLSERTVQVPAHVALALSGYDGPLPGAHIGLRELVRVPLARSMMQELTLQAAGLRETRQRALVLRTGSPAEGKSCAQEIALHLGNRALFIQSPEKMPVGLTPMLYIRGLVPVFSIELGPGERYSLPAIPHYRGAIIIVCGPDGIVEVQDETVVNWELPVPGPADRERLWLHALGDHELAIELAQSHRHSSGRIAQLAQTSLHRCAVSGREHPILEDIRNAAWHGENGGLDAFAQPVRDVVGDDAMIVTPALSRELQLLVGRCRVRDGLADDLGQATMTRYRTGVKGLFVGESGTGKTLAASWLATHLGMPLYKVDLASVTSKYIGETEKNLAQLLARAEHAEVILLFDEADSMFGKRTEVSQANDRYANAQTNYLLQRIETYDGITILTSNSRGRFDEAFMRRLDFIIEFPMPGPDERYLLWQAHLGLHHAVATRDMKRLAALADISGSHIRNVVLAAAVHARLRQCPIEYDDIVVSLQMEFRKLGQQMPHAIINRN